MAPTPIELLGSLLKAADCLTTFNDDERDALIKRSEMIIRRVCGADSPYLLELGRIRFRPMRSPATPQDRQYAWLRAQERVANLLRTVKEEIELFGDASSTSRVQKGLTANSSAVFVVHGHDESLKQAVARMLERLQLTPIILHEQPNRGRTIIEKFHDHADVALPSFY